MLSKLLFQLIAGLLGCIYVSGCLDESRQSREDTGDVWKLPEPLPKYTQHENYHLFPQQPRCGVPTLFESPGTVQGRIRGGHDARLGEYPWLVLVQTEFAHTSWYNCMGSIISRRYILSANHCFITRKNGDERTRVVVFVGDWDTSVDPDVQGEVRAPPRLMLGVEEVHSHQAFYNAWPSHFWHDIALLRLKAKLLFNDFVKPICLPFNHKETQYDYAGDRMTQAGWGLDQSKTFPRILQKLSSRVAVWERCRQAFFNISVELEGDSHSQVCLDIEDTAMTRGGDSGTALMYAQVRPEEPCDTIFYVMGVHSFARDEAPYTVSTWVPANLEWILNQVY